jgi:alpha-tubulin suppressor-like RCC1 family protein
VRTNGATMAWGWNAYGQLGNGTTTTSSTPVASS